MRSLRIPAYAKINLRLHILGRRVDGYHELRTIFQTISLHDTLELALTRERGVSLECNDPSLSTGRDNLVYRAADAMRRELKLRGGVRARLTKRIPVGRGLGGGSSDAAAALIGMQRLAGKRIPTPRLLEIAAGLGADVPFFLLGGHALGVGRGDEIYPLPDIRKQALLLVSPLGIAVNTAQAYGWVSRRLTKRPAAPKLMDFCTLCWSTQGAGLANDFEGAVFGKHPRLGRIKRELLRSGAREAALAGSGSAVFGVYRDPAQARRAAKSFPNDRTFVVETLSRKEYRRALGLGA